MAIKEIVEQELSPDERADALELFKRESRILMASSDVPDWFEKIVMKCVALNPSDRFQSSTELRIALEKRNDATSTGPAGSGHHLISTIIRPRTALQRFIVSTTSGGHRRLRARPRARW